MPPNEWAFVAIGSNVGDRSENLKIGRCALAEFAGTSLVAESTIEETEPLGAAQQQNYLNQMVLLQTARSAHELLDCAAEAESTAGRVRTERWGPRTLDVDIVRFGDHTIRDSRLIVPHPELRNRPFWLRELAELLLHMRGDGFPDWAQVRSARRGHILRVAALVETWAIAMERTADERARWVRAAMGHDAVRDAPPDDLAKWAERQWEIPKLYHGPAAAHLAEAHGETDSGVLDAMRYHTVGYPGWDDVGRMLFLADYLEPGRRFKRKQRAALAAMVPTHCARVLVRVTRRRLVWALKHNHPILPEGAAFWNDLVGSS